VDCITDNELVELLEDRLPSARRAGVLAELERCAECRALAQQWAAASDRAGEPPLDAPPAVGGYRLGDVIGAGAMGLVFRAHDDTLDRDVAIKIVRADDDAARARALAEGRMLATVRHPNVITVHAAGTGDGIAYLAMELATGTSLDHVLAGGPLAPAVAVRQFRGVAAGLQAAHDAGVIHRDIKPGNLISDRDQLRIADFGLASTRGGAPAGTLAYLAPEVGDGAEATPASDQFAFCVTLYEALAGRRPFAALDLAGLRAAWRAGVTSWRGVPARVRGVLARGLAVDPAARWPSMAAIEHALERAQRPRRWPLAAAFAIVLAAGFGWLALRDSRAPCDIPDPRWLARTDGPTPPRFQALAFGYQVRWRAAYADSCTGALAPQQRACLEAARARVDAMFDALDRRFGDGVQALATAPAPERCITAPEATAVPSDPARWRRAQALADLGRYRDARSALPPGDPSADPAELAFLRGTIARELADLPAAEAALRRAVEQASRRDAAGVLADAQTDLAVVVGFLQDRHDAGAAYADAAVATAERSGDARRLAIAHCVQGLLLHAHGDPRAASALLAAAAAELVRIGAPVLDVATAEMRLGWALRESQRPAEARPHVERAAALRRATLGPDHPLTAAAEIEVAMTEAAGGAYQQAIAHERAVIERVTRAYGPDHPGLIGALQALGTVQQQTGDYAGAEVSAKRVLALRRAQGDATVDVGRAYTNLASVYYYQGKYPEAIDAYRAAEATERSLLGGRHPEVALIRSGLALVLQATDRLPEAAAAIADAVAIYRELPGHDRELADALMTQGTIELAAKHLAPARALLEEAEAIQRRLLGPDHVDLAYVLAALGELYLAMDRLADAQRVLERSRALRTQHGVAPQLVAENDFVLAMVAWKQGRQAAAREHARSALALLGGARPELHEQIAAWLRVH
jgi:eukaryotic-like serine/threonine-protein kinase